MMCWGSFLAGMGMSVLLLVVAFVVFELVDPAVRPGELP